MSDPPFLPPNRYRDTWCGKVLGDEVGQDVRVAHNGPAALETAAAYQPELVLLDIGLPGMSGYEVAERLRAQAGFDGAVLAAVTGYGQEEDRRRSRAAGIDYHLVKPVELEAVEAILTTLAKRPATER